MTIWPAEVMRAFTSKEVSFDLEICSIPQCFVWKKFSMDSPNAQVKLYIDLEIIDKAPLLYDYLLLSAHFNKSTQQLVLARSIIVHKSSGEIFGSSTSQNDVYTTTLRCCSYEFSNE
jgi:hypothetical protein